MVLGTVGDTNAIAARIQKEIKRHGAAGIQLNVDQAMEEIMVDALPDVLQSKENVRRLAEENPDLFKSIGNGRAGTQTSGAGPSRTIWRRKR